MATCETASLKIVRPNYTLIHARQLPVDIHPLPPLIPHNPLSILHVGLTFFWQLIFPPGTHRQERYSGYFSLETRSVHVTEARSIRGLWQEGFFGKGTLSRSEPSWLHREKRRLGITVEETAEEITARRRAERKAFKQERARKEREDIEAQHRNGNIPEISQDTARNGSEAILKPNVEPDQTALVRSKQSNGDQASCKQVLRDIQAELPEVVDSVASAVVNVDVTNEEHLQLDLAETFFLVYALGALDVYSTISKKRISNHDLLHLCLANSHFPALTQPLSPLQPAPDDPFFLEYITYHYYRSLGWVVRNGVKFGVNFLLYQRGPVFGHAEFAVLIRPVYGHPYWQSEEAALAYGSTRSRKPWHWLHMINRIQAQVRKTLLLCFVSIPPPHGPDFHAEMDIGKMLRRYEVRDVLIRRWVPNRSRD